jgi:hypothetical protein
LTRRTSNANAFDALAPEFLVTQLALSARDAKNVPAIFPSAVEFLFMQEMSNMPSIDPETPVESSSNELPDRLPFPPTTYSHILHCSYHDWHPRYASRYDSTQCELI